MSMMTNFERAKAILDAMMPNLGSDAESMVKDELPLLAAKYPLIWNPKLKPIDYSSAATQAAYIFTYLGANADLVYQTLCGARKHAASLLSQSEPKIACMGGGPGSDFLGLVEFAERLEKRPTKFDVEVLDHNLSWWNVWDYTLSTIPDFFGYTAKIRKMDYRKNNEWVSNEQYLESDIFIFSYSLSEAWRYNSKNSITRFIDKIVGSSRGGALFIYCDNSGDSFDPHFEREFLGRRDLKLLHRAAYDHMIVGSDEQASALEPYLTAFARKPKLTGNATCAALVKK